MTTPMPISAADLQPLLPELTLIAGAFALLMLDLFLDNARRFITHALALVVMVAVVWMLATGVGGQGSVFSGMGYTPSASTQAAKPPSTSASRRDTSFSSATCALATSPRMTRFTSHSV